MRHCLVWPRTVRVALLAAVWGGGLIAVGPAGAAPPRIPVNDETVAEAVRRAAEFLWSQQNEEGHWDETGAELKKRFAERAAQIRAERRGEGPDKVQAALEYMEKSLTDTILRDRSGVSALALLGLVHAGADPNDPRMVRAIKWMMEVQPTGTYALGLRCALWVALDPAKYRVHLTRESRMLQNGVWAHGTYGYTMRPEENLQPDPRGDFSNTQYGVLGVWSGSEGNVEIHQKYWQLVEHGYLWGQQLDGGWRYPVTPEHKSKDTSYPGSRDALTLGGIATLFVVWDKFYAQRGCDAPVNPELVKSLSRALDWTGKHFTERKKQGQLAINPYCLYALERAGVASGLKYFGEFNWYHDAASYALNHQSAVGSWSLHGPVCGTGWTIMFLVYGRGPVVFNKLAYGSPDDWNARPRDLANLTRWMGNVYERKFNWQIVSIDQPQDLHDAPVLYVSGRRELKLTAEQKASLKGYVQRGGTLLCSPSGRAPQFQRSVQALGLELFPGREFVPVPPDDPLYTAQFKMRPPPQLLGLSNGYRWLVLLSTTDLSCPWQMSQFIRERDTFNLAANLYLCVSDRGQLKGRGHSYCVSDAGNKPARTVTVGRLDWGVAAQSDPEPAAWLAQDIRLRNASRMGVTVQATDLSRPLDPSSVPLLHVTGVTGILLSDQAKANLKQYVAGGGVVLADAAGGSELFARSFRALMIELFGPSALVAAPPGLAFIAEATDEGRTWFRHRFTLPRSQRPLDVQVVMTGRDRPGVIFFEYDLSAAMVGYISSAPVGLTPESADRFIAALLKWLSEPAAPAPAPGDGA